MRFSSVLLLLLLIKLNVLYAQPSHDFEISKNLDIYTSLIQQLDLHYVDDIQPGALSKAAIDAMLKQIDPYTVYYPEAEIEDVRFMQTGKYGGVGAGMHISKKQVVVGVVYKGFAFDKAGIQPGDIIVAIDGDNVEGKNMSDISQKLKGSSGTNLEVEILKAKDGVKVTLNIKREEVQIKDVPYFGLLEPGIGYIKLTTFRSTAAKEVKHALDSMNADGNLKSLVFDLRNNGGGLLIESVKILDLFVPSNEIIVTTKGKTKKESHVYKTNLPAIYPNLKVVVLTNGHSASASEIVAGSFQDLDRAVIMGQKSYGKGLVQKVYSLSFRSQVKITVAKYYIPSGRCIQSLDYQHKDSRGRAIKTPDSLMAYFKTKNGRMVKDAGGIIPDVKLEKADNSEIIYGLRRKFLIFDYVTSFVSSNGDSLDLDNFEVDQTIYSSFLQFLDNQKFVYETITEKELDIFEELSKEKKLDIQNELAIIRTKIEVEKKLEMQKYKPLIKSLLYQEIVSRYYYESGRVKANLKNDKDVQSAVKFLSDEKKYSEILTYIAIISIILGFNRLCGGLKMRLYVFYLGIYPNYNWITIF